MTITRPFSRHFVKRQVRSNSTSSVGFTAIYASTFDTADLPREEVNDVAATTTPALHILLFAKSHHSRQSNCCLPVHILSAFLVRQTCRINEFLNRNVAHTDFILIRVALDSLQEAVLHHQDWIVSEALAVTFIRHLF